MMTVVLGENVRLLLDILSVGLFYYCSKPVVIIHHHRPSSFQYLVTHRPSFNLHVEAKTSRVITSRKIKNHLKRRTMDRPLAAGRRYNNDGRSRSRSRERHSHRRGGGGSTGRGRDRDWGHTNDNAGPNAKNGYYGPRMTSQEDERWEDRDRGNCNRGDSFDRRMSRNDDDDRRRRRDSFGERNDVDRRRQRGVDNQHRHPPRLQQQRQALTDTPSHRPVQHHYRINPNVKLDEKLRTLSEPTPQNEDPRGDDPMKRITNKAQKRGHGMNSESFDPASTLVRPDMRVLVGSKDKTQFGKPLKHDDGECSAVHIITSTFCKHDKYLSV